jgi:hypothetical protein
MENQVEGDQGKGGAGDKGDGEGKGGAGELGVEERGGGGIGDGSKLIFLY